LTPLARSAANDANPSKPGRSVGADVVVDATIVVVDCSEVVVASTGADVEVVDVASVDVGAAWRDPHAPIIMTNTNAATTFFGTGDISPKGTDQNWPTARGQSPTAWAVRHG
jgi:hypothetical protein